MKWKCSNNSCSASLLTKIDKTFHSSNGEHVNHVINNNGLALDVIFKKKYRYKY